MQISTFNNNFSDFISIANWAKKKDIQLSRNAATALERFARHCATSCSPEDFAIASMLGSYGDIIEHYNDCEKMSILFKKGFLNQIDHYLNKIEGWTSVTAMEALGRIIKNTPLSAGMFEKSAPQFLREKIDNSEDYERYLDKMIRILEVIPIIKRTHVSAFHQQPPQRKGLIQYMPHWIWEFLFQLTKYSSEHKPNN